MSVAWDEDAWMACYGDKDWRLDNLYTIKDKDGIAVPFRMNAAQRHFHDNRHNRDLILKARQLGFTTYIQLDMLDDCLWEPNFTAGVIAHTKPDAEAFFSDKIKFAYDHLDDWIKERRPASTDRTGELQFNNGSKISVGTSHRSGTLQYLHVSEFGILSADRPDLAEKVITGGFPTVHGANRLVVESTARGHGGEFHNLVQMARRAQQGGKVLSPREFKFFFFPWWKHPDYTADGGIINEEAKRYFDLLKAEGIALTDGQRYWYVETEPLYGDRMREEYPSTPDEAFESSVKGAYFQTAMAKVRTEGRLGKVPIEGVPVNTFWDLGGHDYTAIWFHQEIGKENRFIRFISGNGEAAAYWAQRCEEWRVEHGAGWGKHYLPHDGKSKLGAARVSWKASLEANALKDIEIVPRAPSTDDIVDGINECRLALASCWFDEAGCGGTSKEGAAPTGIECLDNYRKEWDQGRAVFKRTPRHDKFSHGADAFRTFAVGYKPVVGSAKPLPKRKRF